MNMPDKKRLASEVARVLKPGARFSCSEIARGPKGELVFLLPWATYASESFLVTPQAMRKALEEAGLRIVEEVDLSEVNLAYKREMRARADRGEPPLVANHVVTGDDFMAKVRNSGRCAAQGSLVEHFIVAEKRR